MANSNSNLPEGTDAILNGAADASVDRSGTGAGSSSFGAAGTSRDDVSAVKGKLDDAADKFGDAAAKMGDATAGLRSQAADKARDLAAQGKDRTVGALDNAVKLMDDAASTIDAKVGDQYGAYARQASQAVAGLADTLRSKDVDELVSDARDLVRKSPAIAIGAAAAIGFVIARLVKSGTSEDTFAASASTTPKTAPTPSTATTVTSDFG